MRDLIEGLGGRQEYRLASFALISGLILSLNLSQSWALLAFAIGGLSYVALVLLTYFRLQDASLSGWWLLPMILVFHVGPRWELGSWAWGSITFYPSGFIFLVPVIIGWFAATRNPDALPK
ncbi:hypothetical protein GCM10023264_13100 [Sphingomonas daechungensis]|uniref:DUF805 domain-containing protein n=1 Tax=Sphingomonas daechungensis TaxID=1176646 RepID=A0ABX6SXG8_9SPHN|nr:hypothetical protein [Sphingomonas daechungensis]QNP42296.1 hypothetical protein H9L15_08000 [Sphingomonas daechungensis]